MGHPPLLVKPRGPRAVKGSGQREDLATPQDAGQSGNLAIWGTKGVTEWGVGLENGQEEEPNMEFSRPPPSALAVPPLAAL